MDKTLTINHAEIVDNFETETYLKCIQSQSTIIDDVNNQTKFAAFTNWFDTNCKLSLINSATSRPATNEYWVPMLTQLSQSINSTVKLLKRRGDNFKYTAHLHQDPNYCYNYGGGAAAPDNNNNSASTSSTSEASNQVNSFRFNFGVEPQHSSNTTTNTIVSNDNNRIFEILYPLDIVEVVRSRDNVPYPSVQCRARNNIACLICMITVNSRGSNVRRREILSHVTGRKHLKMAALKFRVSALQHYHDMWRMKEIGYQAHQVYFYPFNETTIKCVLCNKIFSYKGLMAHIDRGTHKNNVLRMFKSPDDRGEINTIVLSKQTMIYDNVPNDDTRVNEISNDIDKQQCKCVITTVDDTSHDINQLIPERFRSQLDLFEIIVGDNMATTTAICHCCHDNFRFELNATNLIAHLQTDKHLELLGTKKRYRYYCAICNRHCYSEISWSKHFQVQATKHQSVPLSRRRNIKEHECSSCTLVIYGDEMSLIRHMATTTRKAHKRKSLIKDLILPPHVTLMLRSKELLEEKRRYLLDNVQALRETTNLMTECCEDIEKALKDEFPGCKIYPFGSRVSGLGNISSDLDLFADIGEMYLGNINQDPQAQGKIVKKVKNLLKKSKDFSTVCSIPSARTPIVKLFHKSTNLDCDVSFRHALGVENTKFITFCIQIQPITQSLILILKEWSYYCKLNEYITNYALAIMAIFYLQTNEHLFSITTLRKYYSESSPIIDGWETINYTEPTDIKKTILNPYPHDLLHLLKSFFNYYAKFSFYTDVVCPLLGHQIPKKSFTESPDTQLPIEMTSYVNRIKLNPKEEFKAKTVLCVQDPFDLSHNLTKGCSNQSMNEFRQYCILTHQHLETL